MFRSYHLKLLVRVLAMLHNTMIILRDVYVAKDNADYQDVIYNINTAIDKLTRLIRSDTN